MATSPDGILEAAFDPARNLTRLVVDGGMWPVPGVLRTNLHTDPRATAIGAPWGYQAGTGETVASSLVTAETVKRTNYVTDPRATTAARWAGATASTETMVTGASDGPTLPDGSKVTSYARYTMTAAVASGFVYFGYFHPESGAAPEVAPAGVQWGFGLYMRVSRAHTAPLRLYARPDRPDGTIGADSVITNGPNNLVAGQWVYVGWVNTIADAVARMELVQVGWAAGSAPLQAGDVVEVTAGLAEPAVAAVTSFWDGNMSTAGGVTYGFAGPVNASPNTAKFDDGPVLPDGSRVSTYIRRAVTSAKTGGTSGPWSRSPNNAVLTVAGDKVAPTMYVRFSVPVTAPVQSSTRSGSGIATSAIETRTIPANTWVRVGQAVVATTAGDNTQVWVSLPAGTVLPVGTTVDQTAAQVERGEPTPYFDGNTLPAGSVIRYWTGAPNASSSVEELMAGPVSRVLIERSSPGVATEPVRTANNVPTAGGWFLGADDAAPMDTTCTYTVSGLDEYGGLVATSSVAVETTGAARGLWLKAPGRPQFTCRVRLIDPGENSAQTQGAVFQVPGGATIPQWSGVDGDTRRLVVAAPTAADVARLRALLATERTLLIQSRQPEQFPSGYWFVQTEGISRIGPATEQAWFSLPVTRTTAPVGEGQGFTGTTYETVRQTYATYADLLAGNATYFDVIEGS